MFVVSLEKNRITPVTLFVIWISHSSTMSFFYTWTILLHHFIGRIFNHLFHESFRGLPKKHDTTKNEKQ